MHCEFRSSQIFKTGLYVPNLLFLSGYVWSTCCATIEGPIKLYCRFEVSLVVFVSFLCGHGIFGLKVNSREFLCNQNWSNGSGAPFPMVLVVSLEAKYEM